MRKIILALLAIFLGAVTEARAENSACSGWFPVDIIACKDQAVSDLHMEMEDTYARSYLSILAKPNSKI